MILLNCHPWRIKWGGYRFYIIHLCIIWATTKIYLTVKPQVCIVCVISISTACGIHLYRMWVCGWVFANFVIMSLKDIYLHLPLQSAQTKKCGLCNYHAFSIMSSAVLLTKWWGPSQKNIRGNACTPNNGLLKLSTSCSFIVASSFNKRRVRVEMTLSKGQPDSFCKVNIASPQTISTRVV